MKDYKAAYEAIAVKVQKWYDEAKVEDTRSTSNGDMYWFGKRIAYCDVIAEMAHLEPKEGE